MTQVEELFARHADELRHAAGDPRAPSVVSVWNAFRAAAREPVDDLRPEVTEDFLLLEVTTEGAVVLDLVRTVGLADEEGDYVGSYVLSCSLFYGDDARRAGAREVQITGNGCLGIVHEGTVDAFAEQAEASEVFRLLAGGLPARELVVSDGPG